MATATFTTSQFNNQPKALFNGVNSVTASANLAGVTASGATTIFFAKVPKGATILDVIETHTSTSASCPADIGYDGTTSAFISAGTTGAVNRAAVAANIPLAIPAATTTVTNYVKIIGTYTPSTAAVSLKANCTVLFTLDA
jgi:expansin (peptidoglycan-binding protein)